jgi:hypothetical protein
MKSDDDSYLVFSTKSGLELEKIKFEPKVEAMYRDFMACLGVYLNQWVSLRTIDEVESLVQNFLDKLFVRGFLRRKLIAVVENNNGSVGISFGERI